MTVQIPVVYLHQSEEYYSDPHTFNPDRYVQINWLNSELLVDNHIQYSVKQVDPRK